MQPITVSFIIVNYKTASLVCRCVQSIKQHTQFQTYEIIVVDNASGDDSLGILSELTDIILVKNTRNSGFGAANNMGAGFANGKYLFFVNPDAYLLNDAVTIFTDFMDKPENKTVVCCGADLVDDRGNKQMSYGNFPSVFEVFSQLGFYRLYRPFFEEHLSISICNHRDEVRQVDYVLGAAMFVRADGFVAVGGFDEQFFLYFEETELAFRFTKAGYQCVIVPQVKMVHPEGSFEKGNYAKLKWFSESRQRYFKKTKGSIQAGIVKFLLSLQALARWLYHRDPYYFRVFRIIVKS
ncbi:hypothetical protein SAMN05216436_1135 [bacterium A37T11]|nr:hypothetical protein SAMN05216436_1135 [bacterium A37T11]